MEYTYIQKVFFTHYRQWHHHGNHWSNKRKIKGKVTVVINVKKYVTNKHTWVMLIPMHTVLYQYHEHWHPFYAIKVEAAAYWVSQSFTDSLHRSYSRDYKFRLLMMYHLVNGHISHTSCFMQFWYTWQFTGTQLPHIMQQCELQWQTQTSP